MSAEQILLNAKKSSGQDDTCLRGPASMRQSLLSFFVHPTCWLAKFRSLSQRSVACSPLWRRLSCSSRQGAETDTCCCIRRQGLSLIDFFWNFINTTCSSPYPPSFISSQRLLIARIATDTRQSRFDLDTSRHYARAPQTGLAPTLTILYTQPRDNTSR